MTRRAIGCITSAASLAAAAVIVLAREIARRLDVDWCIALGFALFLLCTGLGLL